MILEMLGGFLSGGIAVALVNQGLQFYREKKQRIVENKSFVMKEKLKVINEIQLEFKNFEYTTGIIILEIRNYINSNIENEEVEKQKVKKIRDTIQQSSINTPNYLGNLELYLNYFPNLRKAINDNELFGVQGEIITTCWSAENKNDKYFVKRINGIKDENIERKFFENTKQFKNLMHEVKIKLGQEVTEILGNLEE
ncbi:hypothetical protein [Staphylococcus saprophyticus]|uniref:hypothetical protein n=1 Tax=Staphylococcus saprophyticus TaxID=29385 RepID=UPI0008536F17|nr:hypothetical protein [Staphylococcus saprophyticus]MDW3960556.1 hypothetical protein [Staphylococcus saprophyticus]OEK19298.1 hypothetical protein ASS80_12315 [Staphylococcus saprophyticus]QKQ32431.1 hypothetical protein HSZ50_10315 [Staphylococcus saprophyticus]